MDKEDRDELLENGRVKLYDDHPIIGRIVGDLMNLGIDPMKVSIVPAAGIEIINYAHEKIGKTPAQWRNSITEEPLVS